MKKYFLALLIFALPAQHAHALNKSAALKTLGGIALLTASIVTGKLAYDKGKSYNPKIIALTLCTQQLEALNQKATLTSDEQETKAVLEEEIQQLKALQNKKTLCNVAIGGSIILGLLATALTVWGGMEWMKKPPTPEPNKPQPKSTPEKQPQKEATPKPNKSQAQPESKKKATPEPRPEKQPQKESTPKPHKLQPQPEPQALSDAALEALEKLIGETSSDIKKHKKLFPYEKKLIPIEGEKDTWQIEYISKGLPALPGDREYYQDTSKEALLSRFKKAIVAIERKDIGLLYHNVRHDPINHWRKPLRRKECILLLRATAIVGFPEGTALLLNTPGMHASLSSRDGHRFLSPQLSIIVSNVAKYSGSAEVAEQVVSHRAYINRIDSDNENKTPYHQAIHNGHFALAKLLSDREAQVKERIPKEDTIPPVKDGDLLQKFRHQELVFNLNEQEDEQGRRPCDDPNWHDYQKFLHQEE